MSTITNNNKPDFDLIIYYILLIIFGLYIIYLVGRTIFG